MNRDMNRRLLQTFMVGLLLIGMASCGTVDDGELHGVPGRTFRAEVEPYGMVRIPRGAFTMGRNDEDVTLSLIHI